MNRFLTVAYLFALLCVGVASGRAGLSSWVQDEAATIKSEVRASEAIRLEDKNPDAYKTRGMLLLNQGRYSEAARDFRSALALRPNDYLLWLRVGYATYKTGDFDSALTAYNKAIGLAPFYAQPRWYLGWMWLKRGNSDEAFLQLRKAAAFNPNLFPQVLHLARESFADDPVAIQNAIQPTSPAARLELARYFLKHGLETEEMRSFLTSDELKEADRDAIVKQLILNKEFDFAFDIWARGARRPPQENSSPIEASYLNSGFEAALTPATGTFGWQSAQSAQGIRIAIDKMVPYSGVSSLLLDCNGNSQTSEFVVSEVVLVEPEARYQLQVAVKTQELVTGGLPIAAAVDAYTGELLAKSPPFSEGTNDWRQYKAELRTGSSTRAVILGIRRLPCSSVPCPIFGKVWLDDFQAKKL
jgi:tetratricopeptide (TPR) repeat protein